MDRQNGIEKAKLDGSGRTTLVPGANGFGYMALDVAAGKMYWTDGDGIESANLDGTERTVLLSGLGEPTGIAWILAGVESIGPA